MNIWSDDWMVWVIRLSTNVSPSRRYGCVSSVYSVWGFNEIRDVTYAVSSSSQPSSLLRGSHVSEEFRGRNQTINKNIYTLRACLVQGMEWNQIQEFHQEMVMDWKEVESNNKKGIDWFHFLEPKNVEPNMF